MPGAGLLTAAAMDRPMALTSMRRAVRTLQDIHVPNLMVELAAVAPSVWRQWPGICVAGIGRGNCMIQREKWSGFYCICCDFFDTLFVYLDSRSCLKMQITHIIHSHILLPLTLYFNQQPINLIQEAETRHKYQRTKDDSFQLNQYKNLGIMTIDVSFCEVDGTRLNAHTYSNYEKYPRHFLSRLQGMDFKLFLCKWEGHPINHPRR